MLLLEATTEIDLKDNVRQFAYRVHVCGVCVCSTCNYSSVKCVCRYVCILCMYVLYVCMYVCMYVCNACISQSKKIPLIQLAIILCITWKESNK